MNLVNFTMSLQLRSIMAVLRLCFARLTPAHCMPQQPTTADGEKIISDSYTGPSDLPHLAHSISSHPVPAHPIPVQASPAQPSLAQSLIVHERAAMRVGKWAQRMFASIRELDPDGLLLSADLGWDKSSLSTVQSAYPIYLKCNAWPLDEQNKPRGRFLIGYFGGLSDELQLTLSPARATRVRRAMAYEAQRFILHEFNQNRAFHGERWLDADGIRRSVYPRIQCLLFDYIDFALASGTLQNMVCPVCTCPSGQFHDCSRAWEYRDSKRASARVTSVNATEPSRAAVQRQLQPEGLQCEDAPLRTAAQGLDVHSGTAYARLHNDFEGIGKITYESMLQRVQQQVQQCSSMRMSCIHLL